MKRSILPAFLLLCGILSGCGEYGSEPANGYETAALAAKQTTVSGTTADSASETTSDDSLQNTGVPEITITDEYVEVKYKGKTQSVPCNKGLYESSVVKEDYNFDGYYDLFVEEKVISNQGSYWFWDNDAKEFKLTDTLSIEDGHGVKLTPDYDSKTLEYDNSSRNIKYKWKNGAIVPIVMKFTPPSSPSATVTYTYEFDENNDLILTDVELNNSVNGVTRKGDKDTEYFRVTDDAIQHMKGKKVLQIMSFEEIFGQGTKLAEKQYFLGFKQEKYGLQIAEFDLDYDGYNDIWIALSPQYEGDSKTYVYYRFDPESGTYKRWDEVSGTSKQLRIDVADDCLCCTTTQNADTDNMTKKYYKYENGEFNLYKRKEISTLNAEDSNVTVYRYDNDGNEYPAYS